MSLKVKLEKVVNENLDENPYLTDYVNVDEFNNISSQNENLKLLLSYNKLKCEEQKSTINELTSKINDMNKSIENLEHQLSLFKQAEDTTSNEISEKNKYLNTLYDAISCMDINNTEHKIVIDPKTATLRINDFLRNTKKLRTQITDNKILIMSMCKILGCDDFKIVQSMKDIISENENHKRKFKSYEQFYLRSTSLLNSTSSEFHRCGYEQAPAVANSSFCQLHSDSFDHWTKKTTNTRYYMLNKKVKTNSPYPTFTPMKVEAYRNKAPSNLTSFQMNPYLQVPLSNLNHNMSLKHYPSANATSISVYPHDLSNAYASRNLPQNLQCLPDCNIRPNGSSIISYPRPSSSAQFQNSVSPISNLKRFPIDIDTGINESNDSIKYCSNDVMHTFSKTFENAYDWRNCVPEDGIGL